jgi:hypothetical protein
MSDYLTNLAARAHGTSAAVRPRVPSAFEDAPLIASFETTTPPMKQNQIVHSRPAHPVAERLPAMPALGAPPPISAKTRSAPTEKPVLEQLPPHSSREPSSVEPHQASEAVVSDRSLPRMVAVKRTAPLKNPARDVSNDSPPLAAPSTFGAARSDVRPIIHVRKTPLPNPVTVPLRLRPVPTVARPSTATSPPPIHVTIGRVEVRAILPTPQSPRSAPPPAPKLSLDDYLKQRNGGGR